MMLHARRSGHGRPVSFVHGFTQTGRSWTPLCRELSTPLAACFIDAPGHGGSSIGSRSVQEAGDDIAETMSPGVLVGYSMGARMSLHTALDHRERVDALVLISGTAGIEDAQERARRRRDDNALADALEQEGLASFIDRWLKNPMFAGLTPLTDQREDRLTNHARGLADSLRHAGVGTQASLWGRLSELSMPVLLIAGATDKKFADIAERMHIQIPRSSLVILDGLGHTAHLEDPPRCARVIDEWLSTADE